MMDEEELATAERLEREEADLAKLNEELRLDMAQAALDVAGIADPTPISDVAGAALSLYRGDLIGAGLSLISVIPYAGDALAKTAKGARLIKKMNALKKKIEVAVAAVKSAKEAKLAAKEAKLAAKEAEVAAKEAKEAERAAEQAEKAAKEVKNPDCGKPSNDITPQKSSKEATLGKAPSSDYKETFFEKNPETQGKVVVHHAIEQQTLKRYPNVITEEELHSLENLRGIPNELNSDIHLSKIRKEWNKFYREHPNPTKENLLEKATEIDNKFGHLFNPPVR